MSDRKQRPKRPSRRAELASGNISGRRAELASGKPHPDIAILGGPTEDGQGAHVVRIRAGNVSAGEIRPVKDGEPITHNEVVRLRPLDSDQRVCEVEVLHAPPAAKPAQTASGPARVSTPNYRKNWNTIFASKRKRRGKNDWSVN